MIFEQFFSYWYFVSEYPLIFLDIFQYIHKTELSIYLSKLILLSLDENKYPFLSISCLLFYLVYIMLFSYESTVKQPSRGIKHLSRMCWPKWKVRRLERMKLACRKSLRWRTGDFGEWDSELDSFNV